MNYDDSGKLQHNMCTKASVVATLLGLFCQKKYDEKMSQQVTNHKQPCCFGLCTCRHRQHGIANKMAHGSHFYLCANP